MSIIVYTKAHTLMHKQGKLDSDNDKSNCGTYYWKLTKIPKELEKNDRIYFAVKGFIVGYFLIKNIEESHDYEVEFESKSWKDIKPIPTKNFQGFKYADKVEGLQ